MTNVTGLVSGAFTSTVAYVGKIRSFFCTRILESRVCCKRFAAAASKPV